MRSRLSWLLSALLCIATAATAQNAPRGTAGAAEPAEDAAPVTPVATRPDERRSDRPLHFDIFGRLIEFGLSYELAHERRHDFDLNASSQRDRDVLDHELKIDARLRYNNSLTLFAPGKALADQRRERRDGSVRRRHSNERAQALVLVDDIAGRPLSLQLGRIALIEPRAWWWDDDLDAARLRFAAGNFRLETGVAKELGRVSSALPGIDPVDKGVTRWFGHGGWRWAPRHDVELFWLNANDSSGAPAPGALFDGDSDSVDTADAKLRWIGLRASGEWRHRSGHRLGWRGDVARVRGRETRTPFGRTADDRLSAGTSSQRSVRGQAWGLGAQWRLPGAARPTFSLDLASGSGGTDSDALDLNFRQTGLQENKGRVAGVKRVRYYGELLDPQLSNLRIASAGFGLRFLHNSSAEVLLHHYRQNVASTRLAGSRLSVAPLGLRREIGREIDLVVALREWRHVELIMKLSRFMPGAAFAADRRDSATGIEFGATFTF